MSTHGAADETSAEVRLLHLSDTHGMHRSIEARFPLPPADILVHTGDFTNEGSGHEFADFDAWLGELRPRYRHILVIFGNHEWGGLGSSKPSRRDRVLQWISDPPSAKQMLQNATVLEHEAVELLGLRIFGSGWCPWHAAAAPGDVTPRSLGHVAAREVWHRSGGGGEHRFNEIPEHLDVLLTHGAPFGIFDRMEESWSHWGGSQALLLEVLRAGPRAHLFGHIHEQRGFWQRSNGGPFLGGVEYQLRPGESWATFDPPLADYPCDLIACTAMQNHPGMEKVAAHIAGPGRLILARREGGPWSFHVA